MSHDLSLFLFVWFYFSKCKGSQTELSSLPQIFLESFVLNLAKQFILDILAFPLASPLEEEPEEVGVATPKQKSAPRQRVTCPR